MKKLKWIIPVIALAIALGGCPYSSSVPISEPAPMDKALLGKWQERESEDYHYTISKLDGNKIKIEKQTISTGDTAVYKAFLSNVSGDKFMNVYNDEDLIDKDYHFYKLGFSANGDTATLYPITENITEQFSRSADLKAFIEKYKSLSFFYGKDTDVFVRVK